MSRDRSINSDEPAAKGSHSIGAPGEHPPRGEPRDEHPAMTSKRYWMIFNDPGLSPPDGAPADPSSVLSEAFQDLTHQLRTLTGMVQSIIPLVSHLVHLPAIQPLQQWEPPVRAHTPLVELPTSAQV